MTSRAWSARECCSEHLWRSTWDVSALSDLFPVRAQLWRHSSLNLQSWVLLARGSAGRSYPFSPDFIFILKIIIFSLWIFINYCGRSGKRSLIRKESRNRSLTFFDEYCPGEASGHWSSRKNVSQEASGALFELIRQMAKVISRQKK